jgi:hypothetical protein
MIAKILIYTGALIFALSIPVSLVAWIVYTVWVVYNP